MTGGTKGVGEAVVARRLESGADVLTTARCRSDSLAAERFIAADITTGQGCETIVAAVLPASDSWRGRSPLAAGFVIAEG